MASGGRRGKPRRGSSRPKAKRTRYLSLSRIIVKTEVQTPPRSPEDDDDGRASSPPPPPTQEETEVKNEDGGGEGQLAEPFPLHHEASTLFAALPAPSLSDILGASASSSPPLSASPDDASSGGAGFPAAGDEDLARRALRGRERWVYCCSSSSSPTTTATTTCSSSPCSSAASTGASARTLLLKLDYDDVLAAWAGRGSLYIARAAPPPKPEPEPELENVLVEVQPPHHLPSEVAPCAWRWSTPEAARSERAESVRRYKEKRRNRLFDKRIRYEVRRVNAVKRPRFKGRFVKEHDDEI